MSAVDGEDDRQLMAGSVSTRLRQEADFQCVDLAGPRATVREAREFTLPAIMKRAHL